MQAIGAEGIIPAQCKAVVTQYVPELMKAIVTLPPDEVSDKVHVEYQYVVMWLIHHFT